MINIKSASLLNRILCPSSVGMLQNINNGIKANLKVKKKKIETKSYLNYK